MKELSLLQKKVIKEIRKHSKDGIAPSTKKHSSLRVRAAKYFGRWEDACKVAGVKARVLKNTRLERNFYTERLLIALHVASKIQEIKGQKGVAECCIELAREGAFDNYKIM